MSNEMAVQTENAVDIVGAPMRSPEIVLAEAKTAATALTNVVKNKKKPVMFNGEQYLEFEDWQTLATFYKLTAKVVSTNFVQCGDAKGFEARADVIDTRTGMVISSADAMCLNDEDKWSSRPKYEYPDGVKTKVGEITVPMFQLRSMAQTRACSKALRNVLAWVVVLAGYRPTPAEEMTQDTAKSAPKSAQSAAPKDGAVTGVVEKYYPPKGKGPHCIYLGGVKYVTFDAEIGEGLADMSGQEIDLRFHTEDKGGYTNNFIDGYAPASLGKSEEAPKEA